MVRLLQLEALREEGVFRIAGHGLKVKRLVALIDSSECNDEDASHANDVTDPSVFASALKLYLRQLPDPILCSTKVLKVLRKSIFRLADCRQITKKIKLFFFDKIQILLCGLHCYET